MKSAAPTVIDWPAAVEELGRLCLEAVGTQWIPFTYVMIFSRSSSGPENTDRQRYREYRLQTDLLKAWIQLRYSIRTDDGVLPSRSLVFPQNWYARAADKGLQEVPKPHVGYRNIMDKTTYFEVISSSKVDLADVIPPLEHGLTALLPPSEAQPFSPGNMAQPSSSFGMAPPPRPLNMAQPFLYFASTILRQMMREVAAVFEKIKKIWLNLLSLMAWLRPRHL